MRTSEPKILSSLIRREVDDTYIFAVSYQLPSPSSGRTWTPEELGVMHSYLQVALGDAHTRLLKLGAQPISPLGSAPGSKL